jgi:DNA modification methylase
MRNPDWQSDDGAIRLYCGDCLEILPTLADASVNSIVTDPPYGTTQAAWDSGLPPRLWWDHCWRVSQKDSAIAMTACGMALADLMVQQRKYYRWKVVWDRVGKVTGSLDANRRPMRRHEDLLVFGRTLPRYTPTVHYGPMTYVTSGNWDKTHSELYGPQGFAKKPHNTTERKPVDVLRITPTDSRLRHHPTEKPVELMSYPVQWFADRGQTILDPFMGSGSTGVACVKTGRQFVGIEKDPEYFETAKRRIQKAIAEQGEMLIQEGAA